MTSSNDLNDLKSKIRDAKKKPSNKKIELNSDVKSISQGLKIISDMFAGIIVGFTIGYLIDSYFETKPLFIIIFFLIGFTAGILNFYRSSIKDSNNS